MIVETFEREHENVEGVKEKQWVVRINKQQVYGAPDKPTRQIVDRLIGLMQQRNLKKRYPANRGEVNQG